MQTFIRTALPARLGGWMTRCTAEASLQALISPLAKWTQLFPSKFFKNCHQIILHFPRFHKNLNGWNERNINAKGNHFFLNYYSNKLYFIFPKCTKPSLSLLLQVWPWSPTPDWLKQNLYSGIPLSHEKRRNTAICDNTDGSWEYHAEQSKSDGKSQEPYDVTHTWDINQKATNARTRQTKAHRRKHQYSGFQRERGVEEGSIV